MAGERSNYTLVMTVSGWKCSIAQKISTLQYFRLFVLPQYIYVRVEKQNHFLQNTAHHHHHLHGLSLSNILIFTSVL